MANNSRVTLVGMPASKNKDGMTGIYYYAKELGAALCDYVPVDGVTFGKREKVILGRRCFGTTSLYLNKWLGKMPDNKVIHSPHVTHLHRKTNVLTIHDLSFLHFPREYSITRRVWQMTKARTKKMQIVTDAQCVKDELVSLAGFASERVHVAPLAVNCAAFQVRERAQENPYVLMVGEMRPRKHTLEALMGAQMGPADLKIVRVGPPMRGSQYADKCRQMATVLGPRFIDLGYVSRDFLRLLYGNASALLYPSIYEGFGLPPLEAAACGTPSIVGPAPVFTEVLGNLACHTDGSPGQIAAALHTLRRYQQPHALRALAEKYSWSATARAHLPAYAAAGLRVKSGFAPE